MEENSDVHMETDVTSTTDDAVETQEVTGSNGQVEMTITVEKVNEEEEPTSNMETDGQMETNNVSRSLISEKNTPLIEEGNHSIKTPSQNEILEHTKSPAKTESPQKVSLISPVKATTQVSFPDKSAENADSSTKTTTLVFPSKDSNKPNDKRSDFDKNLVTQSSPPKKTILILKRSPVKTTEPDVYAHLVEVQDKPTNNPEMEATEERTYQVIQRSPSTIRSRPIKLIRKQPSKDTKIQEKEIKANDTSIKPTKVPDTPLIKESIDDKSKKSQDLAQPSTSKDVTLETTNMNGEISPEESQKEVLPEIEKPVASASIDVPMDVSEPEASNDSQASTLTSSCEKEHNRSISRELKSLLNSAKESKIISECTQLTSKTRKSRSNLDTSLNTSIEPESMQDDRRDPLASDADKPPLKRSMRSQNPDFVTKCKQFLNSVTSKSRKNSYNAQSDSDTEENKHDSVKMPKEPVHSNKLRSDPYCWRCHWPLEADSNEKQPVHPPMHCTVCVRSYHSKCMTVVERKISTERTWVCPDCLQILHAESSESRSPAMKKITLGMLCELLKFALERMEALNGVEPFLKPVDRTQFPDYDKIVVHPMDMSQMRQNIDSGHYGSTEAFIADVQWILHNSILFNACEQIFPQSKLTQTARALVRTCRAEMTEIETCPECYAGAHSRNYTYFTDVCSTPHIILWAKLKGFPYWPAKAVAFNNGMVDVRFFGQHDKSWVPVRDCYLYSEKDPNTTKHKKLELMQCRQEAELHIRNICRKYGSFVYAPFKTTFDLNKMTKQLKMMIPSFEGEIKVPDKKASPVIVINDSSNSKSSFIDDDASECDEASATSSQKTPSNEDESMPTVLQETPDEPAAAQEVSKEETITVPAAKTKEVPKDKPVTAASTVEKDKPMETDVSQTKEVKTPSRKRQRSTVSDPTVTESPAVQKKKKKPQEIKPESETSQKDDKKETTQANTKPQTEVVKITKTEKTKETQSTDTGSREKDKTEQSNSSFREKEDTKRVTPIKLVALPRADNQTPKLFATAKVTKSTPNTPTTPCTPTAPSTPNTPAHEEKNTSASSSSSSKRSKIKKADKFIITLSGDDFRVRNTRRSSKRNKSITSITKDKDKSDRSMNKSVNKSVDKKPDTAGEASTSKKKDPDRSLLLKKGEALNSIKGEKESDKKSEDDISLAILAQDNRNNNAGLPTISNVVSLSKTIEKTKPTPTTSKTVEITIDANPESSIFTPTSSCNVGNMKEAISKLQKLRNETTITESLVGRVGVKAFARMKSPDLHDEIEVKTEPLDLDEDEERQLEKMDLMNACRLQPVNQTQSLREVRINKVIVNPVVIKKSAGKANGSSTRAKKSFPQPKKPETGSELNGKNSMVYIPIQPPNTQPPKKPGTPNALGPRLSAPTVSTSVVHTVATPLRPTSALSSPSQLSSPTSNTNTSPITITHVSNSSTVPNIGQLSNIGQVSNLSQVSTIVQGSNINKVPTVGPTAVHTVPLMTSVNGQWMFSLQPVMSVGRIDDTPPLPTVNGIQERTVSTVASSSANAMAPPQTPVVNRSQSNVTSPASSDNAPPEMPRLLQRPLLSPFDPNTPIGSLPPPSTAGPLTAKLNQNAVKLTDFFRTLLEDSIEKIDEPLAQATLLKAQLEQARWRHQQNLDEIKHNHELTLSEMRQSFEKEKLRIISETRRAAQVELEAAVKLTKSKQWCSNCHQEAQMYCCWNTSYCDYTCQRAHWKTHVTSCTQEKAFRQLLQKTRKDMRPQPAKVSDSNGNTVTSETLVTPVITHADKPEVRQAQLNRRQFLQNSRKDMQPQPAKVPDSTDNTVTSVTSVTTVITTPQVRQAEPSRRQLLHKSRKDMQPQPAKVPDSNGNTVTSVTSVTPVITTPQVRQAEPSWPQVVPSVIPREVADCVKIFPMDMAEANNHPSKSMTITRNQEIQVDLEEIPQDSGYLVEDVSSDPLIKLQTLLNNAKEQQLRKRTSNSSDKDAPESRLQNSDNPPKSLPAPTPCLTTVGGKPAPIRVFTDSSGTQKTSIIVSMIDDPSGAQKIKCVGTYKAPASTKSPVHHNKQKTDESGAKKTVTSGGYLIVGASGSSNTSVLTPASAARRPQVQYFS